MKVTGTKIYNFLKKAGFNVIPDSAFQRDEEGSWVSTARKESPYYVDNGVYVRPISPNHRELVARVRAIDGFGRWDKVAAADFEYSYKMIEALSEAGYACYRPLYSEDFFSRGRKAKLTGEWHGNCADFYVLKEDTLENLKLIGPEA